MLEGEETKDLNVGYLSFYVFFFIGSMIAATTLAAIFCLVSLVRFMENHKYVQNSYIFLEVVLCCTLSFSRQIFKKCYHRIQTLQKANLICI